MAYVSTVGWGSYFGDTTFEKLGVSSWKTNLVPAVRRDLLIRSVFGGGGCGSGLGAAPSPVGYADFASFQNAVIASFPACPAPVDPACENPRDAAIAAALNTWVTNPASCHNVVCGPSGQPQVSYQPYTAPGGQAATGYGVLTTSGFIPVPAPAVVAAPAPLLAPTTPPPAATYNPVLLFITSRGTNALVVGDTWTISISGAPPNTPVTVDGNTSGTSTVVSTGMVMGSTDGNGAFSLSGRMAPYQEGVWAQEWKVGGVSVGHIAFTVSAAPAAQPPQPPPYPSCDPTSDPTCPGYSGGTTPPPAGGASFFTQSVSVGSLQIPVWGFIVAAGGAILLFMGENK